MLATQSAIMQVRYLQKNKLCMSSYALGLQIQLFSVLMVLLSELHSATMQTCCNRMLRCLYCLFQGLPFGDEGFRGWRCDTLRVNLKTAHHQGVSETRQLHSLA